MIVLRIGFDAKRFFHNKTGLGNYSRDLVRILSHHFPTHRYFLFDGKTSPQAFDNLHLAENTVLVTPHHFVGRQFPNLWRNRLIAKDIKSHKLDIYHGLSMEIPTVPVDGTIYIATVHDLIFVKHPEWYHPIDRFIYTQKLKHTCRHASHIICISEETKKDLVSFDPSTASRISVIYQTCHPIFQTFDRNTIPPDAQQQFEALHLPSQYILAVGTIEKRKNVLQLVKAIQHIPKISLVIVGKSTQYTNEVTAFVKKHALDKRVIILNHLGLDTLSLLYKNAVMSCYISQYEGFGIPIIESLFAKTPVITNKEGVFVEAGGPGCLYVDVNDTQDIAHAIQRLLQDETTRQQLAQKGFDYVQQFKDAVIASNMFDTYQTMLS